MAVDRIAYFSGLVAETPDEPRARYGLAVALRHAERHAEAIDQYRAYLDLADDEGAAWGHLAECLTATGDIKRRSRRLPHGYRYGATKWPQRPCRRL